MVINNPVNPDPFSSLPSPTPPPSSLPTTLKTAIITAGNIKVYINEVLKIDKNDTIYLSSGKIGVRGGFGNHVHFDNIVVTEVY